MTIDRERGRHRRGRIHRHRARTGPRTTAARPPRKRRPPRRQCRQRHPRPLLLKIIRRAETDSPTPDNQYVRVIGAHGIVYTRSVIIYELRPLGRSFVGWVERSETQHPVYSPAPHTR